jgi:hypothetical protein
MAAEIMVVDHINQELMVVMVVIQDHVQDQAMAMVDHVIQDMVVMAAMAVTVDTEDHHTDGDQEECSVVVNGGGGLTITGSDIIHTHGHGADTTQEWAATAFISR